MRPLSLSVVHDRPGPFAERRARVRREDMILNCVKGGGRKCDVSCAGADWLIAVCHSNLDDTLMEDSIKETQAEMLRKACCHLRQKTEQVARDHIYV